MRIKREELYEFIKEVLDNKAYSIGLHGISTSRAREFYNLPEEMSNEEVSDIASQSIVKNGLQIYSARSINGTVAFGGRTDDPDDMQSLFDKLSNYFYGSDKDYILVATPIELTSPTGESIFLGKTNLDSEYKHYFSTTGSEVTSIADLMIPEKSLYDSKVPSRYILGRFKKISEQEIEFEINPEHISSNPLTEEEFAEYKKKFLRTIYSFSSPSIHRYILEKDMEGIEEEIPKLRRDPANNAYLLETITQLKKRIRKFDSLDMDNLEALKETQRKIYQHNIEQKEAYQRYLDSLNNLTDEEVCTFIREKPYHLNDLPKRYLEDIELMRKATNQPDLRPIILCYMGDNVRNDSETMINIVNNCDERYFDFDDFRIKDDPERSDLAYDTIGLDVRCNPLFWESLNTRIYEIHKNDERPIRYFNAAKEIRLATIAKEKQSQEQK